MHDEPTRPPEPMGEAERLLYQHRHVCRQDTVNMARHATEIAEHAIGGARYAAVVVPADVEAAARALERWAEQLHATLERERAEREQTGLDGAQQQRQLERDLAEAEGRAQGWFRPTDRP
jgi:hypothetical protein